jgi:hypothetical protein
MAPELLRVEDLPRTRLLVLAGAAGLGEAQWRAVEAFLGGGGRLWVVAGPATDRASFNSAAAQRVLPVMLSGPETLDPPQPWTTPETAHPLFESFSDPLVAPLSDVRCARRLGVESVAADAAVLLRYSDETAAIATRSVGAGRVVFWNFSPTKSWSNLGELGGQLVELAQRTREWLLTAEGEGAQYFWGQPVTRTLPAGMRTPTARLRRPNDDQPVALEISPPRRDLHFGAERVGHYELTFTEGETTVRQGFSVNVPPAESNFRRIEEEPFRAMFPAGRLVEVATAGQRSERGARTAAPLDLLPVLLLALLTLLVGESFFANRFHERPKNKRGE